MAAGKDAVAAEAAKDDAAAVYLAKYEAEQKAARDAEERDRQEADKLRQQKDAAQKTRDEEAAKAKQDATSIIEEEIKKEQDKKNQEKSKGFSFYDVVSNVIHFGLDGTGSIGGVFAPGVADLADLANCAYYGLEGKKTEAITSCLGAIPIAGDAAALAKFVQWTKKFGSWGKKAADFVENLVKRAPKTCPIRNSFPAGTRVLMGDKSLRNIEAVQVGDQVMATDPVSGATGARTVTATIYTPDDRNFTDISLRSGGTVTATNHHPFWSQSRRSWVNAGDLNTGDTLRNADGSTHAVAQARKWEGLGAAFNLTVADLHTYYVLAGTTPVLVHNTGPDCGLTPETLEQAWPTWNTPANLEHVIDPAKHGFSDLVAKTGGREEALRAIMGSLNGAKDLPAVGKYEVNREIAGEVVTIRGAVVNGVPRIGTAFISGKFPGAP